MYLGRLKLKTAPAIEIVATTDIKEICRVDYSSTDEDDFIADLIQSVRAYSESIGNRAYITQTWQYYLDEFPNDDIIELPRPPLQSVDSINYYDYENTINTLSTTYYNYDLSDNVLYLEYGQSWPSYTPKAHGSVLIEFTAGVISASSFKELYFDIYQQNLAICAKLFDNRELAINDIPLKLVKRENRFR